MKLKPKYRALIAHNNFGVEQSFTLYLLLIDIWEQRETKKDIPAKILNDIREFQNSVGIQVDEEAFRNTPYNIYTVKFMSFYDKDDIKAMIVDLLLSYGLTKEDIKCV